MKNPVRKLALNLGIKSPVYDLLEHIANLVTASGGKGELTLAYGKTSQCLTLRPRQKNALHIPDFDSYAAIQEALYESDNQTIGISLRTPCPSDPKRMDVRGFHLLIRDNRLQAAGLLQAEVFHAFTTDAETDEPIPVELDVNYLGDDFLREVRA